MRIGPYELQDEVGRGGAAVVFRARSADGTIVAVKVLQRTDPQALARFERERRLLASLGEAEGFVPLLDAGASPQGPYLVMPFVSGGTLRARLERGPLGTDETLELGRSLAAALARAHAQGIVHRDLKPENILFTKEGRALVADLGIGKHVVRSGPGAEGSVSLSRTNDFRGTLGYMPPEQMRDSRSVGPAADVFALGAILYECLAGSPAFSAPSYPALIERVESGKRFALSQVRPDAPQPLAAAIDRALAVDPDRRFKDAAALEAALRVPAPRGARVGLMVAAGVLALGAVAAFLVRGTLAKRESEGPAPATSATVTTPGPLAEAMRLVERSVKERKAFQFYAAIESAKAAIALDATLVEAWVARGRAKLERLDFEGARPDFDRAIELDPRLAETWVLRGRARYRSGDRAGAHADVEKALELDGRCVGAYCLRGWLAMVEGDEDAAERDGIKALELDPRSSEAYVLRCGVAGYRLDALEGWAHFQRAVQLDARLAGCVAAVEDYFPELSKGDSVAGGLAIYMRRNPADAWALALHATRRPDAPQAAEEVRRAVELAPNLPVALYARALVKEVAGDRRGEIEDLDRAVELDPSFAAAWTLAASANDKTNRGKARRAVDRAIELDARRFNAWVQRARFREDTGDFDGAIEDYEHALGVSPGDEEVSSALALLRQRGEGIIIEDALPLGARALETSDPWEWVAADPPPFSGARCVRSRAAAGPHHLGTIELRIPVRPGERLAAHAWLDPANPPREVVLRFLDSLGSWAHDACWGEQLDEHPKEQRVMGPLPELGKWVELEVPAGSVGLEGKMVVGLTLRIFDGRAAWDHVVKR
jgi:tetratricopeptide (TPR) repeat protein